jgi:predicted nucleotidyltransferase
MEANAIIATLGTHSGDPRRLGVRRIGLFGSAARGEATEASDLDFLVEFERKTFDAYMGTKELLERLFSHRIDLVLADAVKPRLQSRILAEVIYASGL